MPDYNSPPKKRLGCLGVWLIVLAVLVAAISRDRFPLSSLARVTCGPPRSAPQV